MKHEFDPILNPPEPRLPVNARAYKINKSAVASGSNTISGSTEQRLTTTTPSNEANDLLSIAHDVLRKTTLRDKGFNVHLDENLVTVKIPGENNQLINRIVDQIALAMNDKGYYEDVKREEVKRVLDIHNEITDLALRDRQQKAKIAANKEKSNKPKKPPWFSFLRD
ncbi:MAG TPA: hypothetical protein VI819_00680 [Patescibacteria group bacterium]|nr:hypothetical protein [Patescibacteria group bacterium]